MALDRTELKIYENTGLERERRFAKVVNLSPIVFEKMSDYVFLKIFPLDHNPYKKSRKLSVMHFTSGQRTLQFYTYYPIG
jgi:hypothetical protein